MREFPFLNKTKNMYGQVFSKCHLIFVHFFVTDKVWSVTSDFVYATNGTIQSLFVSAAPLREICMRALHLGAETKPTKPNGTSFDASQLCCITTHRLHEYFPPSHANLRLLTFFCGYEMCLRTFQFSYMSRYQQWNQTLPNTEPWIISNTFSKILKVP